MATAPDNTLGGRPLLDPKLHLKVCLDRGLPTENWVGKATVFRLPLGEPPGTGAVLMAAGELAKLADGSDFDLVLSDGVERLHFKGLVITRVTCLSPGRGADLGGASWRANRKAEDAAACLVELADRRLLLARVPIDAAYNLRKADGSGYHAATLNAGTPYTWAGMLAALWGAVTGIGSSWPGLPSGVTPDGTPENFDYYGGTAWAALCHALARVRCAPKYDPFTDAFSVVTLAQSAGAVPFDGEPPPALDADKVWDEYPADRRRATWPATVRVRFRKFPAPTDGTSPYTFVSVTPDQTAALPAGASGTLTLDDDLAATGSNGAALATRATDRVTQWEVKARQMDPRLVRVYRGYRKAEAVAALGRRCRAAAWEDRGRGHRTEFHASADGLLEDWRPGSSAAPGGGESADLVFVKATANGSGCVACVLTTPSVACAPSWTDDAAAAVFYCLPPTFAKSGRRYGPVKKIGVISGGGDDGKALYVGRAETLVDVACGTDGGAEITYPD